jgi:DeoR/GlpR family transcriptional regulator of sugar metabolism
MTMTRLETATLLPLERKQRILQLLKAKGTLRTADIASALRVSPATVRRDLEELAEQGQIERTHGGASPKLIGTAAEPPFDLKIGRMAKEKEAIADKAARLVRDGATIIFDSGTTVLALARKLAGRNVTCIVLDLPVGHTLAHGDTEVWAVGGRVRNGLYSMVGPWGEDVLRASRADLFFLGADAVDDEVVSNSTVEEASMKRLAIQAASQTILLADHTKFGRRAMARVCGIEEPDVIVTDKRALELELFTTMIDKFKRIEVA